MQKVQNPNILLTVNPFRTAVPFWGQNPQFVSGLFPKLDWSSKTRCSSTTNILTNCNFLGLVCQLWSTVNHNLLDPKTYRRGIWYVIPDMVRLAAVYGARTPAQGALFASPTLQLS